MLKPTHIWKDQRDADWLTIGVYNEKEAHYTRLTKYVALLSLHKDILSDMVTREEYNAIMHGLSEHQGPIPIHIQISAHPF